MMSESYADAPMSSLWSVAAAFRERRVSPVELTRVMLDRIARLNPRFHAYTTVFEEVAMIQARQAEAELSAGLDHGPLHGIPIGVKDLVQVAGYPNTCGSIIKQESIATEDATIVSKLRSAGAVLLGTLNMTEFALSGYHPELPVPVNPWGADRWSGVSSSGSAVAAALGLAYATVGTDTGGSIRFPAAVNGVVGIKPTFGRVSTAGIFPLARSLDHTGPIARSVKDAAVMLQVIAGYDAKDAYSSRRAVPNYTNTIDNGVSELKIGIDTRYCQTDADPVVAEAVHSAAQEIERLGAKLVPVDMAGVTEVCQYWGAVVAAQAAIAHSQWFPAQADRYGPVFRSTLEVADSITGSHYAQAQLAAAKVRAVFAGAFESVDVIASPGAPLPAMPLEEFPPTAVLPPEAVASFISYAAPLNFSGHPSITLPCGQSPEGLPLGLQLLGRHFEEATLIRVAHAYEQATSWHKCTPTLIHANQQS